MKKTKSKLPLWERKLNSAGKNTCVETFLTCGDLAKLDTQIHSITYMKDGVMTHYTPNSVDRKVESLIWLWDNGYMKSAMIKISISKSHRVSASTKSLAHTYSKYL